MRESEEAVKDEDAIDLAEDDFRRARRYLAPWNFAWPGDDDRTSTYPPPSDLVSSEAWDGIMVLPTDVALKSSSYCGSVVARLYELHSQFSGPESERLLTWRKRRSWRARNSPPWSSMRSTVGIGRPSDAFETHLKRSLSRQHLL